MGPEQKGVTRHWAQRDLQPSGPESALQCWCSLTVHTSRVRSVQAKGKALRDNWGRAQEGTKVWFGIEVPLLIVLGGEPLQQVGRFCYLV